MDEYLLAVDAGTSGVRCLIVDLKGRIRGVSRKTWKYLCPDDLGPLGREFDAEEFWQTAGAVIKSALAETRTPPGSIRAVSATSQREGAVFVDSEGIELYAEALWREVAQHRREQ